MIKCQTCGLEVSEGSKFCSECGSVLGTSGHSMSEPGAADNVPKKSKKIFYKRPGVLASIAAVSIILLVVGLLVKDDILQKSSTGTEYVNYDDTTRITSSIVSSEEPDTKAETKTNSGLNQKAEAEKPTNEDIDEIPPTDIDNAQPFDLRMVSFPPNERVDCHECYGSGKGTCIQCGGTGLGTQTGMDPEVLDSFGLGGLNDTLNSLPCTLCNGSKEWQCMGPDGSWCEDGVIYNPEYRQYCLDLASLAEQTGMRIFELEDNQISRYIGIYFCKMCDGRGIIPELKVHETSLPLCSQCFAEGVRLEYIDSINEGELYRDYNLIYSAEIYNAIYPNSGGGGGGAISGSDSGGNRSPCLYDGCSNPRSGGGHHPYCTTHRAGTPIDLGAESYGNCPGCGNKIYDSSAYCVNCR